MWTRAPTTVIQQMLPPPHGDWWGAVGGSTRSKVNTETGLAPDNWDAYETSEFSEPRDSHFPIHRRINSLTWYLVFDIQTGCSLCCKLVYSLTSPASLEQFSQSCWDAVSWAWSPKHYHQIKWLSTFRLWLYFLVDNTKTKYIYIYIYICIYIYIYIYML